MKIEIKNYTLNNGRIDVEGSIRIDENYILFCLRLTYNSPKGASYINHIHMFSGEDIPNIDLGFHNENNKLVGANYNTEGLTRVDGWMGISIEDISKELLKTCSEYLQNQIQELQTIYSQMSKIEQ